MEGILLAVVMSTLLVFVMSLALFDMFPTKILGAGLLASYLFSSTVLGVRPPLSVYFGVLFASLAESQINSLERTYAESVISAVIVSTIVGLILGVAVGTPIDGQRRKALTA
jgi:hypothetical protein